MTITREAVRRAEEANAAEERRLREQQRTDIRLILETTEECGWFTWPDGVQPDDIVEEVLLMLEQHARERDADEFRAATDHRGLP